MRLVSNAVVLPPSLPLLVLNEFPWAPARPPQLHKSKLVSRPLASTDLKSPSHLLAVSPFLKILLPSLRLSSSMKMKWKSNITSPMLLPRTSPTMPN